MSDKSKHTSVSQEGLNSTRGLKKKPPQTPRPSPLKIDKELIQKISPNAEK